MGREDSFFPYNYEDLKEGLRRKDNLFSGGMDE